MNGSIAGKIQKQFGQIDFDNPVISYKYYSVEIETKVSRLDYLNIIAIFLVQVIILLVEPSGFVMHFLIFISSLFIIFWLSTASNRVGIDFFYKKIQVKNKFFFINIVRAILRVPQSFAFDEITDIYNEEGIYYGKNQTRNFIVIKTSRHHKIRIARFKNESDSKKLIDLLRPHIIGKPGIIE